MFAALPDRHVAADTLELSDDYTGDRSNGKRGEATVTVAQQILADEIMDWCNAEQEREDVAA